MDINNNIKSNNKKNIILVIIVILITMIVIGGTYAYMTLSINNITNNTIAFNTTCMDVVYDAGTSTPLNGTLVPSSGPGGGLSGKISLGLSSNCTNIDAYGKFNLNITNASDLLFQTVPAHCENPYTLRTLTKYSDSAECVNNGGKWVADGTAFKYAIYTIKDTASVNPIMKGYLSSNADTVLYDGFAVLNQSVDYYFYIWLDGNLSDDTYAGQSFNGDISASVSQITFNPQPNKPELDPGMIPVTISNDGTVTTISEDDSNWYNYENKEWANVVLVNETSRSNYLGTSGVTVTQSDILAYYVWIPRYKYKIFDKCDNFFNPTIETHPYCYNYSMSDSDKTNLILFVYSYVVNQFGISDFSIEKATDIVNNAFEDGYFELADNRFSFIDVVNEYNYYMDDDISINSTLKESDEYGVIDIIFEPKDASKSNGDAVNTYYTHPAFTWDGRNIGGIWVGKFEITGDATTPTILPNVASLRNQNISTQFATSLKFSGGTQLGSNVTFAGNNTYGLISLTDSHMMKPIEYGAVLYLAYSLYGINNEIYRNLNSSYITGCGTIDVHALDQVGECQNAYGSGVSSYSQSTTGSITGVFDLFGGASESLMGVRTSIDATSDTQFSILPERKYYDLYSSDYFVEINNESNMKWCTLETCGGHALYETTGWYGYVNAMSTGGVDGTGNWSVLANLFFVDSETNFVKIGLYATMGVGTGDISFRSVLIIN